MKISARRLAPFRLPIVSTLALSASVLLLAAAALLAQPEPARSVTVDRLPTTIDQFESLRDQIATTPQGGVVSLIIALKMYQDNPDEGIKALIVALDAGDLSQGTGPQSYKGFAVNRMRLDLVRRQLQQHPYLMNSYFPGTSHQNGYAMTNAPWTFQLTSNRHSGSEERGDFRMFIPSTGADSPRPVRVKRNSVDIWKAAEFSSIVVGVRAPAAGPSAADAL